MKLWSKGLGTKTLTLALGEGVPQSTQEGLLIKGTIKEPVWWDYTITMTDEDLVDLFRVAVNRETVAYLQTVQKPWRLLGTLMVAMGKFLSLWLFERVRWYGRKKPSQKVETLESE